MSRSGCVQPMALVPPGKRIHKALRASQNLSFLFIVFSYIQPYAVVDNLYCSSRVVINSLKTSVFFWLWTANTECIPSTVYWQFHLILEAKQTFGKSIFWSPQKDLVAFERSVLAQFVFPPLSHMTWCILWKQTCCLWFYFRKFSDIRVCVCVCTMACDGSSDFFPFIPGQCGTTDRVDVLEVLRVSEDHQQNQIKCHLDRREWRDCLTAQGNGFALHLLFWLRILFLPLNTNLPCLRG